MEVLVQSRRIDMTCPVHLPFILSNISRRAGTTGCSTQHPNHENWKWAELEALLKGEIKYPKDVNGVTIRKRRQTKLCRDSGCAS